MEILEKHSGDAFTNQDNLKAQNSSQLFKQVEQPSRKCRIGKSISPGTEKGRLEITLLYRNKANFLRENVVINEFVPDNFHVVGSSSKFGTTRRDGGMMISWLIDKVNPNEEIEINYSLKAEDDSSSLKNLDCKAFK
ncbi:MAG: hypothetical protein GYA24_04535 [Candidatus Lokiarchaeota archaeon]|nr:hypothetical protein [Candidatus Lokiarchaeota archaeon]